MSTIHDFTRDQLIYWIKGWHDALGMRPIIDVDSASKAELFDIYEMLRKERTNE